jgi:hypothetical protein
MRLRRLVVLSGLVAALAPVEAAALPLRQETELAPEPEDQIVLSGTVDVPRGARVGEVVVFSGRVRVDGVVTGDVVILEGPVTIRGQVDGSVIAADGDVRLGDAARVGGDVSAGGSVFARSGAEVGGERSQGVRFSLEGPLAALGELLGPVAIAISVMLVGALLLLLAPRGADAIADAIASAPLASLGWGLLVAVAVPIAAVALTVSVLGLPLGLALLLSAGLWWLIGIAAAAWCLGRALVRHTHRRIVALLAGWAVVAAVGLVPLLNAALWSVGPVVGLGAIVVASWRARMEPWHEGRHRADETPPDDAISAGIA